QDSSYPARQPGNGCWRHGPPLEHQRASEPAGSGRGGEKSGMSNQRYIVYVNDPNNKSVGHIETCPHAKIWGGKTTPAGGWLGPFTYREEAEAAGHISGRPFHWCSHCSKDSK